MIGIGTLPQWALLATVIVGALTAWFKYAPDRRRAENENKALDIGELESVIANYTSQISDFRKEVHGYRNDLAKVERRLADSESVSRARSDRINNMMFIIRLLISELRRLDENSIIVKQAEDMLLHMEGGDPHKSTALNAAENTLSAAEVTVAEVKAVEKGK